MKNYNERNSRKRLNALILLVAFTAILLIVSTYAWFSSQKNVTLTGLKGTVNVAEGIQISLDAEHWVNTINFNDFDQTTTGAWTVKNTATTTYFANGNTFQKPLGEDGAIQNTTPDELLPVSTAAYSATNDGIGQTALKFYKGTNTETIKLMDDTNVVTEDGQAGFFAFDVFVMNTSATGADDVLQLDPISDVRGNNEATGVQNTSRVAFALYENNNDAAGFNAESAPGGSNMTISGNNNLTPENIIAGTSTGKKIKDVAIWEPNANKHTSTIVASPANSLKLEDADNTKYHLTADTNTKISKFADGNQLPTYALTSLSLPSPVGDGSKEHIKDVYDWRTTTADITTDAKGVKKQFTLQTDSYDAADNGDITMRPTSVDLVSTKKWETAMSATQPADPTDSKFTIKANQYQKIRIYFWMEGQDPDCINAASLGGGLTLDIGFSKPGTAQDQV
mgnify:FL=1